MTSSVAPRRTRIRKRFGRAGALASALFASVWVATCQEQQGQPDLAPHLLHDEEEMAAYLEAFPASEYSVAEVPGVGRFYVDSNRASV